MCSLVPMTEPIFSYPARINSLIDTDYHVISFPQSSGFFLPAPLTKMPEDSGNEIATNTSRTGYLRVFYSTYAQTNWPPNSLNRRARTTYRGGPGPPDCFGPRTTK